MSSNCHHTRVGDDVVLEREAEVQQVVLKIAAGRPIVLPELIGQLAQVDDSLRYLEIKPRGRRVLLSIAHLTALLGRFDLTEPH
jgi:hypothetical protein